MSALLARFKESVDTIVSGHWRHPDRRPLWAFASERTKVVEIKALEEARRSGHDRVGTEHLLLGILAEGSGQAAASLGQRDILLPEVRSVVELLNGTGPADLKRTKWFITPQHTAALFAADEHSRKLDHTTIEPEHILYGILQDEDAAAVRILRYLGVNAPDLLLELRD